MAHHRTALPTQPTTTAPQTPRVESIRSAFGSGPNWDIICATSPGLPGPRPGRPSTVRAAHTEGEYVRQRPGTEGDCGRRCLQAADGTPHGPTENSHRCSHPQRAGSADNAQPAAGPSLCKQQLGSSGPTCQKPSTLQTAQHQEEDCGQAANLVQDRSFLEQDLRQTLTSSGHRPQVPAVLVRVDHHRRGLYTQSGAS